MAKKSQAAKGLSQRAYASHRGVTPQAVALAVKSGRISLGKDGRIDPITADRDWEAKSDPANRRPSGPKPNGEAPGASKFAELRTALTATKLRRENNALESELKNTIRVDDARKLLTEFIRTYRDALLNFPNRYGQQIAAEVGIKPTKITAALDKFVRQHLTEVADHKIPHLLDGVRS